VIAGTLKPEQSLRRKNGQQAQKEAGIAPAEDVVTAGMQRQ